MRFFISYAYENIQFVDKLSLELAKRKIPIWLDRWEIEIGDSLNEKIINGIENSSHFMIVISKDYFKSDWCGKEFVCALEKERKINEKFIIPLRLEDIELPDRIVLNDILACDFTGDFDSAFSVLMDKLSILADENSQRSKKSDGLIDWAITDKLANVHNSQTKNYLLEIDAVEFSNDYTYSIITKVMIVGNERITREFIKLEKLNLSKLLKDRVLQLLIEKMLQDINKFQVWLKVTQPVIVKFQVDDLEIIIRFCIVGKPTVFNVKYDFGSVINMIYKERNK